MKREFLPQGVNHRRNFSTLDRNNQPPVNLLRAPTRRGQVQAFCLVPTVSYSSRRYRDWKERYLPASRRTPSTVLLRSTSPRSLIEDPSAVRVPVLAMGVTVPGGNVSACCRGGPSATRGSARPRQHRPARPPRWRRGRPPPA